jgi:hypothetical protein
LRLIGHDADALGEYFAEFPDSSFTHVDPQIEEGSSQAQALYDEDRGVAIIRTTRMIHGYQMSQEAFNARLVAIGGAG